MLKHGQPQQSVAKQRLVVVWLSFVSLFPGSAFAVQDSSSAGKLEELVVVASKVPRSIHKVAANVTVVDKQEITDNLTTTTSGVFQYTPGIDVESAGTRFGAESINIRGIGGNRVAVLIDGVPLGDQFDIGNFSNATRDFINAGLIQRVEVLHGSASSLYGSNAIGGVVATYTPDPSDVLGGNGSGGEVLATYRDADESAHLQAMFATGQPELGFLAAASVREGHEFELIEPVDSPDLRDYRRESVLLKLVADNYQGHSWRLGYIHQRSESQNDSRLMLGSGRFRSTTQLQGDDDSSMDLLSFEYDINALQPWFDSSVLRAYYQQTEVSQDTLDERLLAPDPVSIQRNFLFEQDTTGLELNLQKEIIGDRFVQQLGIGLEYLQRNTEELRDGAQTSLADGAISSSVLGETFPLRDFPKSSAEELGAYLEYSLSFGKWTAIAALRADRYKLDADPDAIYIEDNPATPVVSLSESDVSPKLGLIYHLSPTADIYLQYAHGFRSPPFEDANIGLDIPRFNIRALPNPDLKSESSDGFDIGLRWANELAKLQLGAFRTSYDDFIETKVRLGQDPLSGRFLFQSQNLSEAVIEGVEASWQINLPRNFEFTGSVYVADGSNQENQQPLNSVGPEQLIMGLGWVSADQRRTLRLRGTFTGQWNDRDQSGGELFIPESYSVFDLYYSQKLTDSMMLRAGIQNLGDKKYWSWSDIRGFEPDDEALAVLARPGRSASVSLNLNW